MNDSFGVSLATLVIAASAITARHYWDWDHPEIKYVDRWAVTTEVEVLPEGNWDWGPPTCVDRENDDHCFRDLYRAQLEALEANTWYDEVQAVSPTGVAFSRAAIVRRSSY